MPAELNRPAPGALFRSDPGHLQPRSPDGRIIKYRQLISAIACLLPVAVLAGPKNGQVVAGVASISTPDANTTVIRQSTDKSVINWQSFSIGSQEYVKFVQPDKSSLSLNRVIGGDPSSILGKLSANGQVYLVNPNGIYFGQGAEVDVSSIVASVLDISNTDFMNENFVFQGDANANLGKVINDGIINARNEGFVVLLGDYSENNGVIQAHMGKVVLASGSHITMDISGNNLISVAVNEATVNQLAGVKNTGDIYADGGRVIMTAKVADNLIGSAVNNQGLVRASSIVEQDGAIFLTASGGDITNSGTLDASAAADSNVDGGGVLVYTDKNITLASGGAINARGDGSGAGGVVRVIAEDFLDFQAAAVISVAGAPQAGGFVEVSGHGGLLIRGDVDTGSGGDLVIDPAILTITNSGNTPIGTTAEGSSGFVGKGFIEGQLNLNTNVTLIANSSIVAAGGSLGSGTPTFEITALTGNGNLTITNGTVGGGGSFAAPDCSIGVCLPGGTVGVAQESTGNINLGTVSININGGLNIAAGSDVGTVSIGAINAGGNVSIAAGSNINLKGVISGAGTSLAVTAGNVSNATNSNGNINLNGGIGLSTANPLNADVTLNANNDVNIDANIFLGNNSLKLAADHADGVASTGNSVGNVNIIGRGSCTEGCFGEPRTVSTRGAMNISGVNLNVNGADFGTRNISRNIDASVLVSADDGNVATTTDNITVNITGQMNVGGGKVIGNRSVDLDVSVQLSAGNDLTVNANGLSVQGGNVAALASPFAASSVATVKGNADVSAGRDISLTLGGALSLAGGNATATAYASNASATGSALAAANANLSAGRDIIVNSATGLAVTGGSAKATAGTGSADCLTCRADASAKATLTALNITTAPISGDVNFVGGNATATVKAAPSTGSISFANAIVAADSAVLVSASGSVTINAGGSINASGGAANVGGSLASASAVTMNANASVQLSGGTVSLNAGGANKVSGGNANVGGNWTGAATVSGNADANAFVSAASGLTMTSNTGLNVSGGIASASPVRSSATNGTASASARAELNAGGLATVNVTAGSVSLIGGFSSPGGSSESSGSRRPANRGGNVGSAGLAVAAEAARPSGSSGTTPLRKASANAVVSADQLQMVASANINGSSASIDANGIYLSAGNNVSLFNTITTVGNGTAPGVSGDSLLLDIMDKTGIGLPANSSPNAMFEAGSSLDTGDVNMTASNGYLWFSADQLSVGSISAPAAPLLVQYSPVTPTSDIGFENSPSSLQSVNYDNLNHVTSLPMTTVAIGSANQSGPITVGVDGMIDIGARNIIFLTTPDNVNLTANVITTGIVATSGFVASVREEVLVGSAREQGFVTPRLDNFQVETESWWLEAERRKQQLIEEGATDNGMCVAL